MLHASITIDLPSEPYPPSGRIASLVRWVLSGPDPRAGHTHITVSALAVFEKLLAGVEASGFDDVISVLVGRKPVYIDTQHRLDDIQEALEQTAKCGSLGEGFKDVHCVVSRPHDGMHSLVDVTLDEDVLADQHELSLRWSTRMTDLRVRGDENPAQYLERVRAALGSDGLRGAVSTTTAATEQLATQLEAQFGAVTLHRSPVVARVVVPGPTQIGRFRHLGFGQRLRARVYRPEPKDRRVGAYDDPHVYYYFDPYHDLLSWVLVQEALAGRWDATGVEFLHPDGRVLFRGGEQPIEALEVPSDAVQFGEHGLTIADEMPAVGFDRAEAGSPHAPGWGGENG